MPELRPEGLYAIVVACGALVAGWWLFAFTLDDAYIAWRYASNLMDGQGLVWNPAPFRPVEGYTSLLWVLIVSAVWAVTGIEPPDSANVLLLGCSLASVCLTGWMAWRLPLSDALSPHRLLVQVLVLAGVVSNRTFLIWSSSGLEQALLTAEILAWVALACWGTGRSRVVGLGLLAGVIELTRPDGLLFVAAWVALAAVHVARSREAREITTFAPVLVPVVHLAWRWSTYGDLLPNTYYAKHAAPWPLAGTIYLSSFLLEYALYVPLLVGAALAVRAWRAGGRPSFADPVRWLALGAVGGQLAYYTFDVGGDHFGYRVYHHLVPLAWLGTAWMLARAGLPARRALGVLTVTLALGLVIPWTHHALTEDLAAVRARDGDPHRISMFFPPVVRLWPMAWEAHQTWLRNHFVCIRRRAHVNYITEQRARFGTREDGLALDPGGDIPVIALNGVGYPAWALPRVAIVDQLGLNDAVIARTPVHRAVRKMAHDRQAPPGYVACFRPNVTARAGDVQIRPRARPLTADDVRRCESMSPTQEPSP